MAPRSQKHKTQKAKMGEETRKFLEELNGGRLTFGQLLASIRESEEESLAQFSERLGVTRQHLHQLEKGGGNASVRSEPCDLPTNSATVKYSLFNSRFKTW